MEHFTPLFVALGAATDPTAPVVTTLEGYSFGLQAVVPGRLTTRPSDAPPTSPASSRCTDAAPVDVLAEVAPQLADVNHEPIRGVMAA